MSISKTILIGNLGGDPEVRYMPNGNAVANLTLATSEKWRDKATGEPREKTEWHRVVVFGKLAEVAGEYLRKGSKVYIEGQNETREWEKDGIKRYTTEVVVKVGGQMRMLDGRQDGGQQQHGSQTRQQPRQQQQPAQSQHGQGQQRNQQPEPPENQFDDDIPF